MASLCVSTTSTATLIGITRAANCRLVGGLDKAFLFSFDQVDWTATKGALNWDDETEVLSEIVFLEDEFAVEVPTDGGPSTAGGDLTESGLYDANFVVYLEGQDCARDLAIRSYQDRCDLVALIVGKCYKRLVGVTWNGTDFEQEVKPPKLTGHNWTFGEADGAKPSDTLTFTWQSGRKPICADGMTDITTS
jgi:hypothetical protein